MKRTKIILGTVLTIICMAMFGSMDVNASGIPEDTIGIFQDINPYNLRMESIKNGQIIVEWNYQNYSSLEDFDGNRLISIQGFELELSTDSKFPKKNGQRTF